jgi:imidazolonepropionase-like amidohydrolase
VRPPVVLHLCLGALLAGRSLSAQENPILFHHVRVFDGSTVIPVADVLIKQGKIIAVDSSLSTADARVVDGTGKTLLPGFIDAHVHVHGRESLEQALAFGVTTELDMMMRPGLEKQLKSQGGDDVASFFSAGFPATVPGGHGTEYGLDVPTLTRPSEAAAFVDARLREGSDYIKIMYTAGVYLGPRFRPRPTLNRETVAAVVAAAHERHRLAVVHIGSLDGARDVIEAGADGLAHLFHGPSSPGDFGEFVAAHHAFVIPTLSVLQSSCGPQAAGAPLVVDSDLGPFLDAEVRFRLREMFPVASTGFVSCRGAKQAVRQLATAGVPILAGSDAPNPGTGYGVTLHGELALLVDAGLTPIQALVAATSAPASAFHIPDRGRIAPGMRADLVLVSGNPADSILATRRIVSVYKNGVEFNRDAYRKNRR